MHKRTRPDGSTISVASEAELADQFGVDDLSDIGEDIYDQYLDFADHWED